MLQTILDALNEHNVALLTGPGGTGKTYNINKLCEEIEHVARTATTGVAATHIKGETIHRFSGIGIYKSMDSLHQIVGNGFFHEVARGISRANLIVIDEVSMLHRSQFELMDEVFKYACGNTKPFGGKKILFSGDFLQLPPVNRERRSPWVFHSKVWRDMSPPIIELTKIWRQDDKEFTETLMNIRKGFVTDKDNKMIASRNRATFTDGIEPVKLVSTNKQADVVNRRNLDEIEGELFTYKAQIEIYDAKTPKQKEFKKKNLINDMIAPETLEIKVGAQVMILVNGEGYCNGTMGKVVECTSEGVGLETIDGMHVFLEMNEWTKLDMKDQEVAAFRQIPLKLAYAVTVHKSQGMSLDRCEIDFANMFAPGQAYVALSRVRSLEGLSVKNWDKEVVFSNQDAYDFYYKENQ